MIGPAVADGYRLQTAPNRPCAPVVADPGDRKDRAGDRAARRQELTMKGGEAIAAAKRSGGSNRYERPIVALVAFHRPYKRICVEKGDERRVARVDYMTSEVLLDDGKGGTVAWKPEEIGGRQGGRKVCRAEEIELHTGDHIRWTRNDAHLGLALPVIGRDIVAGNAALAALSTGRPYLLATLSSCISSPSACPAKHSTAFSTVSRSAATMSRKLTRGGGSRDRAPILRRRLRDEMLPCYTKIPTSTSRAERLQSEKTEYGGSMRLSPTGRSQLSLTRYRRIRDVSDAVNWMYPLLLQEALRCRPLFLVSRNAFLQNCTVFVEA